MTTEVARSCDDSRSALVSVSDMIWNFTCAVESLESSWFPLNPMVALVMESLKHETKQQ